MSLVFKSTVLLTGEGSKLRRFFTISKGCGIHWIHEDITDVNCTPCKLRNMFQTKRLAVLISMAK
jgi:hypothetical protein